MSAHVDRRLFVFGTAACLTDLILFRQAYGQTLQAGAAVPTIDSLSIKVLMDSSHDVFLRAPAPKAVTIKRFNWPAAFPKNLHNQWGLSLALESKAGSDTRSVLLDFGYQPEELLANVELLGVDPAKFDAIVLSHGHFDHFGGLVGFLQRHRAASARFLRPHPVISPISGTLTAKRYQHSASTSSPVRSPQSSPDRHSPPVRLRAADLRKGNRARW
jgi:7,8-dihydropterin-6-yl-methyl-4-(beta-D-ribofuranosyl)aminobenzene 5'-phosphate synthase